MSVFSCSILVQYLKDLLLCTLLFISRSGTGDGMGVDAGVVDGGVAWLTSQYYPLVSLFDVAGMMQTA